MSLDEQSEQASATRDDAKVKDDAELVRLWLDAINLADSEESHWREAAQETVNIYRNSKQKLGDVLGANDRRFNILHSNVETIIPAVYNSTPIPDVRRRFNDDDKAGKEVADLLERALSFAVDSYDFDDTLKHDVKDMEITGRGVSRVRYVPYITEDGEEQESSDEEVLESAKEPTESLTYEEVICEHVPWKHFRRGPARTWPDVPWVAFELFLTREELVKLSPELGGKVNLDTTLAGADSNKRDGENLKEVFKRARVWEIWDKESRKVLFIAPSYKDKPIKEADDPLDLMGFFPLPRPLYAIETSDSLIPVIPYDIYRDQAEELERVSRRIMALVESIKSRGIYDGSMKEIDQLAEADDNTLIPVENAVRYADGSGLDKGIAWWPVEAAVKALAQLVEHRDRIKQTIYEITGISDILRGESEASETATAQNIKQQWGSLRIQTKQGNIARYARDLFRLKAEIIANKFQWQTITLMTGLDYPSQADKQQAQQMMIQQGQQQAQMAAQQAQATGQQPPPPPQIPPNIKDILEKPTREEVEQLLRNDATRNFRVDVESDSTIRADMTRNQQNMTQFLQGTAQFAQAMGPIVMTFKDMTPAVMEVYSAFARNFKLGKQAEDALDGVADKARQMTDNPQPEKPDPALLKIQADMQAKQQEMQINQQQAQAKLAADQQSNEQKLQFEREKHAQEMEFKRQEHAANLQIQAHDLQMRQVESQQNAELKQQEMAQTREMAAEDRAANMAQHQDTMGLEREKTANENNQREQDRQLNMFEGERNRSHDIEKVKAPGKAENSRAEAVLAEIKELRDAVESPVELIRDAKTGRVAGVKRGKRTMLIQRDKDGRAERLQ